MDHDDVRKRMRGHIIAFVAILALAMMSAGTVLAGEANVTAVLAIAGVQVLVVLFAMMHATQAGPWVRWVLVFCAFGVFGLAGALYVGYHDTIDGTEHIVMQTSETPADSDAPTEAH